MQEHSTLILGAGLTGLCCAYHLGEDYLIVEKESEPGGIVGEKVLAAVVGGVVAREP